MLTEKECKELSKHLKELFKELKFDDPTHSYTWNGKKLISVSELIKYFYKPFDSNQMATDWGNKRGIEPSHVIGAWSGNSKISTDRGHRVHKFGEDYGKALFGYSKRKLPTASCMQELGVVQWYKDVLLDNPYLYPVGFELPMYHPTYLYA